MHAAELRRLLERQQEVEQGPLVVTRAAIRFGGAPGGDGGEPLLASQGMSLRAVGIAIFQHQVHPLLHDGGAGVPVEGVLEDDEIVLCQQCLLALHVYIHVRVLLIEVVQGDPLQAVDGLQQLPVGPGALQRRVRENNQNAFHGVIT